MFAALALACALDGFAQPIGVATWNLNWLMDEATARALGDHLRAARMARSTPMRFRLRTGPHLPDSRSATCTTAWRFRPTLAHPTATAGPRRRTIRTIIRAARPPISRRGRATRRSSPRCARCSIASTSSAFASSRCRRSTTSPPSVRSCRRNGRPPARASTAALPPLRSTSASRGGTTSRCAICTRSMHWPTAVCRVVHCGRVFRSPSRWRASRCACS